MNDAILYPPTASDAPPWSGPADDATSPPHFVARIAQAPVPALGASGPNLHHGRVLLDKTALRTLRQSRLLSQQDLADDCWRRNIRVSIATIKRAESGRAVRYRIARELARCFEVPVANIMRI